MSSFCDKKKLFWQVEYGEKYRKQVRKIEAISLDRIEKLYTRVT